MLKKRLVFTLLYDSGYFTLSRNFHLQRVGNLEWLQKNYDFSQISFYIDELIILNVTRGYAKQDSFLRVLENITKGCFVPIAAGGWVRSVDDARNLLCSGADKIILNTAVFTKPSLLENLAINFGQQCIVASIDFKRSLNNQYSILIESGTKTMKQSAEVLLQEIQWSAIGECYLNSIDQDGTGQGYDLDILSQLPKQCSVPIIMAGGAGKPSHMKKALINKQIDAVATANLLNFVGDGLQECRKFLIESQVNLASWPSIKNTKLI
jgi:cyclase